MKEKSLKIIVTLITVAVLGLVIIQFYWIRNAFNIEYNNFNKNVGLALSNVIKQIGKNETTNVLLKTISENNKNNSSAKTTIKIITNGKETTIIKNDDAFVDVVTLKSNNKSNIKSYMDSLQNTFILKLNRDSLIAEKTKIIEKTLSKIISTKENKSITERIKQSTLDSLLNNEFKKYGINTKYNFAILSEAYDSLYFLTNPKAKNELLNSPYRIKLFPNDILSNSNYLLLHFPNKTGFILKSIWFVFAVTVLLTFLIIALFYITIKMLIRQKQITEVTNDLLNNITHQFKTPLATIAIASDIINENDIITNKEKVQQYSAVIKTESKRLSQMIENILTVARFEKNNFAPVIKETNIIQTIKDVVGQFSLIAKKQNAEITFKLSASNLPVNIDESLIKNALGNLIDNALKYNNGNIKVNISVKSVKDGIEIFVEDNGIGVSKNHLENIFETFYRVPTGNIHNIKGNGIGLSITKKIIEAHSGNISVTSELNKGTIFKIFLPDN